MYANGELESKSYHRFVRSQVTWDIILSYVCDKLSPHLGHHCIICLSPHLGHHLSTAELVCSLHLGLVQTCQAEQTLDYRKTRMYALFKLFKESNCRCLKMNIFSCLLAEILDLGLAKHNVCVTARALVCVGFLFK